MRIFCPIAQVATCPMPDIRSLVVSFVWPAKMKRRKQHRGRTDALLEVATIVMLGVAGLAGCSSQPPPAAPPSANLGATEGTVTFTGVGPQSVSGSNGEMGL